MEINIARSVAFGSTFKNLIFEIRVSQRNPGCVAGPKSPSHLCVSATSVIIITMSQDSGFPITF